MLGLTLTYDSQPSHWVHSVTGKDVIEGNGYTWLLEAIRLGGRDRA